MPISVNSSRSALAALQTLARGPEAAAQQGRTGAPQKTSQDRAGSVAAGVRPDVVSLAQMKRALDRAASISDVAMSAGQSVSDILQQLQEQGAEGQPGASGEARLQGALRQIDQIVRRAGFDGVNLLDGSLTEDLPVALGDGSQITLPARDVRPGGPMVTLDEAFDGSAETRDAELRRSSVNVSSALADLRIQGRQLASHSRFLSRLGETLVSEQADGDLSKEGARLQALRVQQQLAAHQLPIANQSPTLVLQLFRS